MASKQAVAAGKLREATPIRQKSGFVRSASAFDAFVFALAGISVGIMFEWGNFFGNAFYPGGNPYVALLISLVVALVVAWAYQYWGQVFPRTGGDYVFLSRGLHPGFALGVNFVYCFILMVSPAFAMSIMQPLIAGFVQSLGDAASSHTLHRFASWLMTNNGYALIGTVDLAIALACSMFGLKAAIRYMKILFLTGLAGQIVVMIAMAFSHTSTFAANIQQATGHSVGQIVAKATATGFTTHSFDLHNTLQLTDWYVTSLFFAALLLYIGSEIKNASRTIRIALAGAVTFCVVGTLVWTAVMNDVVSSKVQGALAWNSFAAPGYSTPFPAYPHELTRYLWGVHGGGLVLTIIGYLAPLAWVTLWTPLVISFTQRGVVAWALDGLTPRWVGHVSERRHVPVPALLIAFAMGEAFMLAFAYRPSFRTIILLVPLFIGIGITMAVGTFFPYTRRQFIEQSTIRDARTFGVHRMTIACGLGTLIMIAWSYIMWNDHTASGTDRKPIWVTIGIAVAIVIYYLAFKAYKRSQGEDISVTFKRIPVE